MTYRPEKVTRKAIQQAVEQADVRLRALHWLHRWIDRLTGGRRDSRGVPPEIRHG